MARPNPAQLLAKIVGMDKRIHAAAIGGGHGMERLERERHAGVARIREKRRNPITHLRMRAGKIS